MFTHGVNIIIKRINTNPCGNNMFTILPEHTSTGVTEYKKTSSGKQSRLSAPLNPFNVSESNRTNHRSFQLLACAGRKHLANCDIPNLGTKNSWISCNRRTMLHFDKPGEAHISTVLRISVNFVHHIYNPAAVFQRHATLIWTKNSNRTHLTIKKLTVTVGGRLPTGGQHWRIGNINIRSI